MRIPRLYVEQELDENSSLIIEGKRAHYISNVLRMQPGRQLVLFNGDGQDYQALIESSNKKSLQLQISLREKVGNESPLKTTLAIAISKGDRMDWVVQKTTELGVKQIQPLFTERGEVKLKGDRLNKKLEHWQQVAISACEQSQRAELPLISTAKTLTDYLSTDNNSLKLLCHFGGNLKLQSLDPPDAVSFLIGPEGGLNDEEVKLCLQAGYQLLTVGPRVLRTETAPVTLLSLAQHLWGDF